MWRELYQRQITHNLQVLLAHRLDGRTLDPGQRVVALQDLQCLEQRLGVRVVLIPDALQPLELWGRQGSLDERLNLNLDLNLNLTPPPPTTAR